jgi:hypothetical protein
LVFPFSESSNAENRLVHLTFLHSLDIGRAQQDNKATHMANIIYSYHVHEIARIQFKAFLACQVALYGKNYVGGTGMDWDTAVKLYEDDAWDYVSMQWKAFSGRAEAPT